MASLVAPDKFSPVADAEALRRACQGFGTDEKAIINILGHRNAAQKKKIKQAYEDFYEEELVKRLESELSGDFEKSLYRWILDPEDRDAVLSHVAIQNKDYGVIVEISCTQTPEELLAVKKAYQVRYKLSLEEDIAAHTSGDLRKLLAALVGVYRYHGDDIDQKLVKSETDLLHKAIKHKEPNHADVIRIVTTRSKAQVIGTLNHYKTEYKTSITEHLKGHKVDGAYLAALHTTIDCIDDTKKYYVKVLGDAINKLGTDEDAITRVVVTRAEKDLKEIKELYHKTYSVPLEKAVAEDTSGDYEDFILTLLGKED